MMTRHWGIYGGREISNAARATWRACEATTMHAPLVDENMAIWLEGVCDGLHMMLDQLNIDSCLPGRDRREASGDPEAIWMAQEAERERNRRAMEKRKEHAALPAPAPDADAIRAEAERIVTEAVSTGHGINAAAARFVSMVSKLVATEP
jgi:hypothetical protein